MSTTKENGYAIFDAWFYYDQVLDHNYMFHEDIFGHLEGFLDARFGERPFSVLDLGCGSARHMAPALKGKPVSSYLGFDLSEKAAELARINLQQIDGRVEIREGELLDGLIRSAGPFDLIISSFALHHLDAERKRSFFENARSRVSDRGLVLVIDVMRDDDETLEVYLDRYCAWLEENWPAVTPEGRAAISEHIRSCDFPASRAEFRSMAADAGFAHSSELPGYGWHRTLAFEPAG